MLKSRMELEPQRDDSKVLCVCGHTLEEHDYEEGTSDSDSSAGVADTITNVCNHLFHGPSHYCNCTSFVRAINNRNEDE